MLRREPGQEQPAQEAPRGNGSVGLPWMVLTCCIFPRLNANLGGDHPASGFWEDVEKILGGSCTYFHSLYRQGERNTVYLNINFLYEPFRFFDAMVADLVLYHSRFYEQVLGWPKGWTLALSIQDIFNCCGYGHICHTSSRIPANGGGCIVTGLCHRAGVGLQIPHISSINWSLKSICKYASYTVNVPCWFRESSFTHRTNYSGRKVTLN